jgi:hypothetical protein
VCAHASRLSDIPWDNDEDEDDDEDDVDDDEDEDEEETPEWIVGQPGSGLFRP